jgi:hypothetical protein
MEEYDRDSTDSVNIQAVLRLAFVDVEFTWPSALSGLISNAEVREGPLIQSTTSRILPTSIKLYISDLTAIMFHTWIYGGVLQLLQATNISLSSTLMAEI